MLEPNKHGFIELLIFARFLTHRKECLQNSTQKYVTITERVFCYIRGMSKGRTKKAYAYIYLRVTKASPEKNK